ncbi:hypothetical protein BB559_005911 [Furculomyces boomerangus]|uniref:FAD-binding FR-type domain-containing protein n=1 Tax=Furculomyces boomerangus TaxID=61424 RepID=A0A2T9Y5V1_9FUNG|nr:hypothetical protein BB559_005911 [Furculomyces boomerangus]
MAKDNKHLSIKNEITLTNKGVFLIILGLQIALFVKSLMAKPGKSKLKKFFFSTILPLNINFGLIFTFMSPTLMSLQRRLSFNIISKIIRPKKNFRWLIGWRSIRMENTVSLHVFTACWFLFWAFLHVGFGLFMFYLKIYESKTPKANNKNNSISDVLEAGFFDNFKEKEVLFTVKGADQYILVTGLFLTTFFVIIGANAIPIIRKKFFELFYITHHFFILAIVAFTFHSRGVNKIWGIPIALYTVDRFYQIIMKRRAKKNEVVARKWSNSIVELRIPITETSLRKYLFVKDICGKFIYINVSSISYLQWHPFDVASTIEDGYISILVSINNGWTNKFNRLIFGNAKIKRGKNDLYNLSSSSKVLGNVEKMEKSSEASGLNSEKSLVNGSNSGSTSGKKRKMSTFVRCNGFNIIFSCLYDSMVHYVVENETAVLVAGGTGVGPMISIIKCFIRNPNDKRKTQDLKNIYLAWSCRERESFLLLEETIAEIIARGYTDRVKIFLHLTEEDDYEPLKITANEIYTSLSNNMNKFVKIILGRHDIYSLLEAVTKENPGNTYGIAAVGPKGLIKHTRRTTVAWNRASHHTLKVNYYQGN